MSWKLNQSWTIYVKGHLQQFRAFILDIGTKIDHGVELAAQSIQTLGKVLEYAVSWVLVAGVVFLEANHFGEEVNRPTVENGAELLDQRIVPHLPEPCQSICEFYFVKA